MPIQISQTSLAIFLALLGIGVGLMFPNERWLGFALIILAIYILIIFGVKREKRSLASIGIIPIIWIILGTITFVGGAIALWYGVKQAWPPPKIIISHETPQQVTDLPSHRVNSEPLEQPTFREKVDKVFFQLSDVNIIIEYPFEELTKIKVKPFEIGGYYPITSYVENDRLYADTIIYGGANNQSIKIVHNEIIGRKANWDKNSNNNALEIINGKTNPVFQIIYKSKTHIIIKGIFPHPNGVILAGDNVMHLIPTHVLKENPGMIEGFVFKRIFKYPSWKYPGQLD